ncbi:hypothetical protein BpHYR1_039630 [Brachionus plicatilis]|uniref:Uncharacterized protein n=1 Tax=Brachionus plicatilis TaxID=10195 RepID=A0A3M7S8B4_BRAPC|nr:hypothetical protein BpHYR1_039630 [Brachionus plicatilis]
METSDILKRTGFNFVFFEKEYLGFHNLKIRLKLNKNQSFHLFIRIYATLFLYEEFSEPSNTNNTRKFFSTNNQ